MTGVRQIVVTLAPGDDFEVDVWCIPDVETLLNKFAVVETIGALALWKGTAGGLSAADAFWAGLKLLFDEDKSCQKATPR